MSLPQCPFVERAVTLFGSAANVAAMRWILAALAIAMLMAGCTRQESTEGEAVRTFVVDVPPGAGEVRVQVTAVAAADEGSVSVRIEDDQSGADLASDRFSGNASRTVTADATGVARVLVRVSVDRDAQLDVRITAGDTVVEERVVASGGRAYVMREPETDNATNASAT